MKPLKDRLVNRQIVARGNLATSYQATDVNLGRTVFLKVLHTDLMADADTRARFQREARAAARLDHPNLVRLFEFGEDPADGMYMVLEWVNGQNLAVELRKLGVMSPDRLRRLARDILSGLMTLHKAGIIHRDIKPENILITRDGQAKITDFSLATLSDEPRLTHHLAIVGTPSYMAPEQAAGKAPDERSDLFAAGVVLYDAATGQNPFAAGDVVESLRRVRQVEPDYTDPHFAALPIDLQELIRGCLKKSPDTRLATAVHALAVLHVDVYVAPAAARRRALTAGVAVVGLLITVTGLLVTRDTTSHISSTESDSANFTTNGKSAKTDSSFSIPTSPTPGDTAQNIHSQIMRGNTRIQTIPIREQDSVKQSTNVRIAAMREQGVADSVDVLFDIQPWAHVYFNGQKVGTSPFRKPVRLPSGKRIFSFQNAEMPRIEIELELSSQTRVVRVNLAEHVGVVDIGIVPWGNVYVDDEAVGPTPLKQPLIVMPGEHAIRITHPALPEVRTSFYVAGGDTLYVSANLDQSSLAVERGVKERN